MSQTRIFQFCTLVSQTNKHHKVAYTLVDTRNARCFNNNKRCYLAVLS
ncbi:MAG: hypothetical protein DDT25_01020 [Chloroflexi bacterium]|nr:hypothetical protein [Chloroflexota bacterium]